MNNKIDILGISEANLDCNLEEFNNKIQDYTLIKSPGSTARIVTYIRNDLTWRELSCYGGDLSCNWVEVGKGKSKVLIGQYYREFKILGKNG